MKRPAIVLCVVLLTGCAAGPDYQATVPETTASFAAADGTGLRADIPDGEWWQEFNDPTLNQLIEQAAASNYDVRIAIANLRASRALLQGGRLELAPIITAEGSKRREKQSEALAIPQDYSDDYYDAGFDVSWEIDIFGRVRRSVEALKADYESEEAAWRER